ncbi:gfo/Idh/MocA family oxidoreductase [Cohnella faecalis]|uniref:Gfo/Idh/MocA family oxidoreductase n=2 Tax=Cohnella faecalis TaxID=2315694 RepID=A0A398CCG3_9BACL|nr:gfo/Idh/MocA family oxidoreductase [Cohnella faecalis]
MIIGAGTISRHHAEAFKKLSKPEEAELYVTDLNEQALQDFCTQYPKARPCKDVDEMLALPVDDKDIVIVATPPRTHHDLAVKALRSGRHVLCEKPFAMNREEAEDMVRTAEELGLLIACCSARFLDVETTGHAIQLLRNGALGNVYRVEFVHKARRSRPGVEHLPALRWFLNRAVSGGGCLMDWGPYDFTTLNEVLEPTRIDVLSAWMANPETALAEDIKVFDIEEHVGAALRYHRKDGSTVIVEYERAACTHGKEYANVQLEGTQGAAYWDWLCYSGDGNITRVYDEDGKAKEETTSYSASPSMLTLMDKPLVFFDRTIRGQDAPSVVNRKALFNFAIIDAIYACIRTGAAQTIDLDSTNN